MHQGHHSKQPKSKEDKKSQNGNNKKKMKGETNIKQNFAKPHQQILDIIPSCNNIYTIQRNDN